MYLKTKSIEKRLWSKDNFVSKNSKYTKITLWNQLIFDKSVYDICICKERLFCYKQIKEKVMLFFNLLPKLTVKKKHNIVLSN
jgi:hypothetical protein